jgi:hypothetical protein
MKWALINSDKLVVNVIAYDGEAEYTPEVRLSLEQVSDWLTIGDDISKPAPEEIA